LKCLSRRFSKPRRGLQSESSRYARRKQSVSGSMTNDKQSIAFSRHSFPLLHLVPIRRLDAEQVMDEEVVSFPFAVSPARPMSSAGDDEQVEGLVGFDQRVDHLHRRGRIDVGVQLADD